MIPNRFSKPIPISEYPLYPSKNKGRPWCLSHLKVSRKRKFKLLTLLVGIFVGFFLCATVKLYMNTKKACIPHGNVITIESQNDIVQSKEDLLLIGVITASKYINTRAKSVYETWGRKIPGSIYFFSSENSTYRNDIPIVRLEGVDDSYPPQKKSFRMLQYFYHHHINDFEFFFRADDDLYMRPERLEKFLNSINSSKLHFIGSAGLGLPDEREALNLGERNNFCMGGPGMLLSKATLKKLGPYLEKCLEENLMSNHEDVELGRCITKYVGISCTWSFDMANIFHHDRRGPIFYSGSLKQKEIHRSITLHPVKHSNDQYKIYNYFQSLAIKEKEAELVKLIRELKRLQDRYNLEAPDLDDAARGLFLNHLGTDASFQKWSTTREDDVVPWDFLTNKTAFQLTYNSPRHKYTSYIKEGVDDAIREIMETIDSNSAVRGRTLLFKDLLYCYKRHHPKYGAEYVLDIGFIYKKYRGKKMTVPVRRHAYVEVPFGPLYVTETSDDTLQDSEDLRDVARKGTFADIFTSGLWFPAKENGRLQKKINFILPLAGRFKTFLRFMDKYRTVCLEKNENVRLIIISFRPSDPSEDDSRMKVNLQVAKMVSELPSASIDVLEQNTSFARGRALQIGSAICRPDDLLFFIDVDVTFTSLALDRVRWHTIQHQQVYFPIIFSEFNPIVSKGFVDANSSHFVIDEDGYWRDFGYGIGSIYASDLSAVGGLNTLISGWGGEDIDLFDKILKNMELKIMRAADPDLVHIYHPVYCQNGDLASEQYSMCLGSRYSTYASSHTLVNILEENPRIISPQRNTVPR